MVSGTSSFKGKLTIFTKFSNYISLSVEYAQYSNFSFSLFQLIYDENEENQAILIYIFFFKLLKQFSAVNLIWILFHLL